MTRLSKAVVLTVAAGATVLGTAAGALAHDNGKDDGRHKKQNHSYGERDGNQATATGVASNSPGVLSGNVIQIPVNAPSNFCGNNALPAAELLSLQETVCTNG